MGIQGRGFPSRAPRALLLGVLARALLSATATPPPSAREPSFAHDELDALLGPMGRDC